MIFKLLKFEICTLFNLEVIPKLCDTLFTLCVSGGGGEGYPMHIFNRVVIINYRVPIRVCLNLRVVC